MPRSDARETRKWREFRVWPAAAERLKPRGVRVTIQQARHSESDICISQLLEKGFAASCAGPAVERP
jgi:hypothetical protein